MLGTEITTDKSVAAQRISKLLNHVRQEGRRTLVVVGAGCSYAAGMPLMKEVYAYLLGKLSTQQGGDRQVSNLREWLSILEKDGGPRSLAAQTLGLFQQPQLIEEPARGVLQRIWQQFAIDFLSWQVAPGRRPHDAEGTILSAKPTKFHTKIADWVRCNLAQVLSLNFDGLTRKAIERAAIDEGKKENCAILAKGDEIDHYFFGDRRSLIHGGSTLWAVIKARGDVFHASCRNELCPACFRPAPLYDLQRQLERRAELSKSEQDRKVASLPSEEEKQGTESEAETILRCSECGTARQLEISFTGYQRKEEEAEEVVDALCERVMPGIGGVITVGVSGLWDDALLDLLKKAGQSWTDQGQSDHESIRRIICIDPNQNGSFLASRLVLSGIAIDYLAFPAEDLVERLGSPCSEQIGNDVQDTGCSAPLASEMRIKWTNHLFPKGLKWPEPLEDVKFDRGALFDRFRRIRQLGLKTALVQSSKTGQQRNEENHNRLVHSASAAYIGLAWLNHLIANKQTCGSFGVPQYPNAVLRCAVFLACLTHDLNHLPFTHLIEDVFGELHWTTSPWSGAFHHDRDVLSGCQQDLKEWADDSITSVGAALGVANGVLAGLVNRIIEGRSGIPVLDAIVNSPIDADKIEYVASDSLWMEQQVHLPVDEGLGNESRWRLWLETFITGQRVLPSGIIGISGDAAENAYRLLEERRWLYKHLYFRPPFRVIERILRHLVVRWLTWNVGRELADRPDTDERWLQDGGVVNTAQLTRALGVVGLGDPRSTKGRVAAELLWQELMQPQDDAGEPRLAISIAKKLAQVHHGGALAEWYQRCASMLELFLKPGAKPEYPAFEKSLQGQASWSGRMYIKRSEFDKAREIVRSLEYGSEPSALIDLAPLPPMLSYPDFRRSARGKRHLYADCWAVPHQDPERWGKETGRWVPLGRTALARHDLDENRWVQILVISPHPNDRPALQYLEDRFRLKCDREKIQIFDEEPQGN